MPIWIAELSLEDVAIGTAMMRFCLSVSSVQAAISAAFTLANSVQTLTSAGIKSVFVLSPVTAPNGYPAISAHGTVQNQMIAKIPNSAGTNVLWLTIPAPVNALVGTDSNQSLQNTSTIWQNFLSVCHTVGVTDKYGNALGSYNNCSGFLNTRIYTVPTSNSVAVLYNASAIGSSAIGTGRIV